VEVFKDRSLALPPLNTTLARRMMEQTRIYTALKGVRGRDPIDLAALEQLMVQFSQLVVEQRWIKEIDINPLLASPERLIALDARVVLHDAEMTEDQLPRLAIRPYPTQYISSWEIEGQRDGQDARSTKIPVTIRPIRPEDEPLVVKFHEKLSDRSVYFRYFHLLKLSRRISHERLTRICFIDYDREMALVADWLHPETGEHELLGFGRLSKLHGTNEGEFGLLVGDRFQHRGLGTELLRQLLQVARDEKLDRLSADILPENLEMQRLCEKAGFSLHHEDDVVKAKINF
jgi:acetyltransferase